jgi:hypothetical protein
MSSVTVKPSKCEAFLTSEDLHNWLSTWPTVSAQLKLVVIGLRRRQVNETSSEIDLHVEGYQNVK